MDSVATSAGLRVYGGRVGWALDIARQERRIMKHFSRHQAICRLHSFFLSLLLASLVAPPMAAAAPASTIPAERLVQPAQLAGQLAGKGLKPLVLQVGFRTLYDQAHIPGADYAGPGNTPAGLEVLRSRVAAVPHDAPIVIYCGCCPWSRCPNIAAADEALHALGFSNVKVLYIAENFGTDWVDKGYPAAKGP
jgi:thiosulfate/3-mercaptopyruvate sulfurtransferase